ncbi:MAG TPA: hypothetical protein VK592_10445, partial [Candidatus Dormibacteraeota bacterium]|nr:hypothetical protein [Candidatus Dormibacteraeota bacterium]
MRSHLAADPRLASRVITTVVRTLSAWQRRQARRRGVKLPRSASRMGCAVVFVQRFDSALRVYFHLHLLLADGVFVRDPAHPDARPRLVPLDHLIRYFGPVAAHSRG